MHSLDPNSLDNLDKYNLPRDGGGGGVALGVLTLLALTETWSGVLRSPRRGHPQCSCPRSPGTEIFIKMLRTERTYKHINVCFTLTSFRAIHEWFCRLVPHPYF